RPIHTIRDDVPAGLVGIIDRCLEKTPDLRFPSAKALSTALRPFETDRVPTSAEHVSPSASASASLERAVTRAETTAKWPGTGRRSSRLDRRALAVIVVILALGAAGSWYALRSPSTPDTADAVARNEPATVDAEDTGGPLAAVDPVDEAAASDGAQATGAPLEGGTSATPATEATQGAHATDATPEGASEGGSGGPARADTATTGGAAEGATGDPAAATSGAPTPADEGDEGGGDSGATPSDDGADTPPPPVPEGAIRFEPFITPRNPGPVGDHGDARRYCEGLASVRYLGITSWK